MAIKASASIIMIMKTVLKKHVNHKGNMFLNVFCFRYYKSCLEPLHARYVTNEMTTGGCHRDPNCDVAYQSWIDACAGGFGTVLDYGDESSKDRQSA
jgi:hypothetical protein